MLFIWDVHWHTNSYWQILQKYPNEKSIQVGDFWFKEAHRWHIKNLDSVNHKVLFWNHDDYAFLHSFHSLRNIKFLPSESIMTIRWADSIDKHLRIEWANWWRNEELEYKDFLLAIRTAKKYKPRIIVSHDCPQYIREKFFGIYDKSTTSNGLQAVLETWKPEIWIFGHHHIRKDEVLGSTRFICLEELWTIII